MGYYDKYKFNPGSIIPGSQIDPYDWSASSFQTTPFSVPQTDKFDLAGTLYGLGALAEGVGNAMRAYRGESPVRMAQENLQRYLNKDKPNSLQDVLAKYTTERGASNNPVLRSLLSTGIFSDTFSV